MVFLREIGLLCRRKYGLFKILRMNTVKERRR